MDIDLIISQAVASAALLSGVPASLLIRRNLSLGTALIGPAPWCPFAAQWLPEEEAFLRAQIGKMSDGEIGAALGRSENAIKIKRTRRGMPSASKRPGWITGNGAAHRLGVDIHLVMRLVKAGIMPAEILPGERGIMAIKLSWLYRWAVQPAHWVYFKHSNVTDMKLRRLLELKRARWGDEWWSTGQVAAWHGVDSKDVERFILAGNLRAVRWNNWRVLRSEAMRPGLHFPKGKGAGHELEWSEAGDAFFILARAVGISLNAAGRMTGIRNTDYRLDKLWEKEQISYLVQKHGLDIMVDPERRLVFADWSAHAGRFPRLARAMGKFCRFLAGEPLFARKHRAGENDPDLIIVRSVLCAWAAWYAKTDEQKDLARRLAHANHAKAETLRAVLEEIRSWGVDPMEGYRA